MSKGVHSRKNVSKSKIQGGRLPKVNKSYADTSTRDRMVQVRKARCPDCGAEPDDPCVRNTDPGKGTPLAGKGTHAARRRMAVRQGLFLNQGPRQPTRTGGITCPRCGAPTKLRKYSTQLGDTRADAPSDVPRIGSHRTPKGTPCPHAGTPYQKPDEEETDDSTE
jgi:ribosomal protein S27AE